MNDEYQAGKPEDDAMQSLIGKQLRSLYDSVLAEPIPDNLVELLVKLDDVTSKADKKTDGDDETASE